MKRILCFALLLSSTAFSLVQNQGTIIINKKDGSSLYMECAMMEMGSSNCEMFRAVVITQGKMEKVNNSLYKSLLNSKGYYINGEKINYNEYFNTTGNVRNRFDNTVNNQKRAFFKTTVSILLKIAEVGVIIGETVYDGAVNTGKKSKDLFLKAKYKKTLKNLFMGEKNKIEKVSNRKFKKLVKFISNI